MRLVGGIHREILLNYDETLFIEIEVVKEIVLEIINLRERTHITSHFIIRLGRGRSKGGRGEEGRGEGEGKGAVRGGGVM